MRDWNPAIAGEMKPDKLELERSRERTNRPAMSHSTPVHVQKEVVFDEFQEERRAFGSTKDCLRERRRDACLKRGWGVNEVQEDRIEEKRRTKKKAAMERDAERVRKEE